MLTTQIDSFRLFPPQISSMSRGAHNATNRNRHSLAERIQHRVSGSNQTHRRTTLSTRRSDRIAERANRVRRPIVRSITMTDMAQRTGPIQTYNMSHGMRVRQDRRRDDVIVSRLQQHRWRGDQHQMSRSTQNRQDQRRQSYTLTIVNQLPSQMMAGSASP